MLGNRWILTPWPAPSLPVRRGRFLFPLQRTGYNRQHLQQALPGNDKKFSLHLIPNQAGPGCRLPQKGYIAQLYPFIPVSLSASVYAFRKACTAFLQQKDDSKVLQ